ncbi:MAG TPA: hypothetical protein VFV10_11455 [Gammaproteobacteria bacterium]|nr:hypothetical protein [Gammaproteobacteria bacterium]
MLIGIRTSAVWLVGGLALGCTDRNTGDGAGSPGASSDATASPSAEARHPDPDAWVGRWTGPEGTYLDMRHEAGGYAITIKDLDAARTFEGAAAAAGIEFERDGVRETLHATDGDGTGMKWLAGKQNCLTVRRGEGYCRD